MQYADLITIEKSFVVQASGAQ